MGRNGGREKGEKGASGRALPWREAAASAAGARGSGTKGAGRGRARGSAPWGVGPRGPQGAQSGARRSFLLTALPPVRHCVLLPPPPPASPVLPSLSPICPPLLRAALPSLTLSSSPSFSLLPRSLLLFLPPSLPFLHFALLSPSPRPGPGFSVVRGDTLAAAASGSWGRQDRGKAGAL